MDWKEAAPWITLTIVVAREIGHYYIDRWRTGELENWRKDVDDFVDEIREAKGKSFSRHDEHERRIARLERIQDDRARDRGSG